MRTRQVLTAALGAAVLFAAFAGTSPALAEPIVWGIRADRLEYRAGDASDVLAWEFDAFAGTDELKVLWRSEAEFASEDDAFETLENQLRLQKPISDFFEVVAGVRLDTPEGADRAYGVIGIHGLAPQWFEVEADLFVSDELSFRFEAEYEALLTNRLILTPVIEIDLPVTDDRGIGVGAWGPKLDVGGRLSYDLVDRAISPYVGVHYERAFGETADLVRDEGGEVDAVYLVVGTRIMF